jgi:hypothetical protein
MLTQAPAYRQQARLVTCSFVTVRRTSCPALVSKALPTGVRGASRCQSAERLHMCPRTTSYSSICVLVLPHTAIHVCVCVSEVL